MITSRIGLGVLMGLAGLEPAPADVVTLQNGDQIHGKVLQEQGDTLLFRSELFPDPLRIPLESIGDIVEDPMDVPEAEKDSEPEKPTPLAQDSERGISQAISEHEAPAKPLELPENWDARLAFGFSDQENEVTRHQEVSAEGSLAWKGERQEAQWRGYFHYQSQENDGKSADRYGVSQKLRHSGDKGFYVQAQTKAEVDNVTRKRAQASQTAGLGYAPISKEKLTVNVTPGFKAEHVSQAELEEQNGTAYKAHVQQDLKWKVSENVAVGQALSYSVDPRNTENWDMDLNAFVETKVSDDVHLRLQYRRDFLNQVGGAEDRKSSELGASLVWDF